MLKLLNLRDQNWHGFTKGMLITHRWVNKNELHTITNAEHAIMYQVLYKCRLDSAADLDLICAFLFTKQKLSLSHNNLD